MPAIRTLLVASAMSLVASGAMAQSGSIDRAVGGYNFEDAAKEAAGTKDFKLGIRHQFVWHYTSVIIDRFIEETPLINAIKVNFYLNH